MRNRILIPIMANVVFALWGITAMYWVSNWDVLFPDRAACANALIEAVRVNPGETRVDTPRACLGFDKNEHREIVTSIPWGDLFPHTIEPQPEPSSVPSAPPAKKKPSAAPGVIEEPSAVPSRETPKPKPSETDLLPTPPVQIPDPPAPTRSASITPQHPESAPSYDPEQILG